MEYNKEGKAIYFLILHTDYFFDAQNINSNSKITDISYIYVSPWCSGYDYCTTLFNSGSAQVQIQLATCRKFAMVRISDVG